MFGIIRLTCADTGSPLFVSSIHILYFNACEKCGGSFLRLSGGETVSVKETPFEICKLMHFKQ